jgi:hypothetical protein
MESVLMERYTDNQTWYIIFDKSYTKRRWWLHKDFQHVHLVRDNRDFALMVNSFAHVMAVREYPNSLEDFIAQELSFNPTAILQLTVHYGSHYRPAPIELLTCVSVAKRLLGIRHGKTPKQLYHELIKAGALVIKGYTIT